MQLGMIGLGRMGAGMVRRLMCVDRRSLQTSLSDGKGWHGVGAINPVACFHPPRRPL